MEKLNLDNLDEAKQQECIKEFRILLGDESQNFKDHVLLRFLIARKLNVVESYKMLLKNIQWRKENDIDNKIKVPLIHPGNIPIPNNVRGFDSVPDSTYYPPLDSNVKEEWKEFFPYFGGGCYHSRDKDGFPIYIERIGKLIPGKLVEVCSVETLMDFHLHNVEFLHKILFKECSEKSGRDISMHTIIFDLEGISFSHLKAMHLLQSLSEIDNDNYPETMRRLFVVNAPSLFSYGWKMIKGWLDERTIDKVHIIGTSKSEIAETLLNYIDIKTLPTLYGGNCECSHMVGGCCPILSHPDFKHLLKNNKIPD
ncbi:hypothetical protein HK099_003888, partial [Clydaea vesicula]